MSDIPTYNCIPALTPHTPTMNMHSKITEIITADIDTHMKEGVSWNGTKAANAILAAFTVTEKPNS
jgi:hypothetical protein